MYLISSTGLYWWVSLCYLMIKNLRSPVWSHNSCSSQKGPINMCQCKNFQLCRVLDLKEWWTLESDKLCTVEGLFGTVCADSWVASLDISCSLGSFTETSHNYSSLAQRSVGIACSPKRKQWWGKPCSPSTSASDWSHSIKQNTRCHPGPHLSPNNKKLWLFQRLFQGASVETFLVSLYVGGWGVVKTPQYCPQG